jgi:hypothetical protein
MVGLMSLALAATTLLSLTAAAPANQIRSTGVIHRIFAGSTTANGGLHFEPESTLPPHLLTCSSSLTIFRRRRSRNRRPD